MKPSGLLALACAAALTVACNGNGRSDTARTDENGAVVGTSGESADRNITSGDRDFVQDLSFANQAEVELGRYASEHAANADVKRFGQMMVDDHTKAFDELKQIAMQYSVPVPVGLDEKHRDLKDKLSKLRGAEFDKQYMDAMVDGHQDVVDKLQSRVDERDSSAVLTGKQEKDTNVVPEKSDNAVKASLNAWAANALPVVKAHLDKAKAIKDTLTDSRRNSTAKR